MFQFSKLFQPLLERGNNESDDEDNDDVDMNEDDDHNALRHKQKVINLNRVLLDLWYVYFVYYYTIFDLLILIITQKEFR